MAVLASNGSGRQSPRMTEAFQTEPVRQLGCGDWYRFAQSQWWQRLKSARTSVLILDYDGTLAPFVRERMEAKPYAGVSERLTRLAIIPEIRLAILSGRPVKDFSSLLPRKLNVEIWGSHGRERLCADGSYQTVPLNPIQKGYLAEFEKVITSEGFAFALEHKVGSLALHTRGLDGENANRIIKVVRNHYEALALREKSLSLEWLSFDGGIEIRARGWTKGDAVASILAEFPSDVPVACLGDDQTDEDAFAMLHNRVNAASVLVRSQWKETAAKWWLIPPEELLAFLDRYLEVQG